MGRMTRLTKLTSLLLATVCALGLSGFAASPIASVCDTTEPLSLRPGASYTFRITVSQSGVTPSFTVGNGSVLKTQAGVRRGSDFYFRVTATGKPGDATGVYTTLPGQQAVKQCVITIAGAPMNPRIIQTAPVSGYDDVTELFALVNAERAKAGVPALEPDPVLTEAAEIRAKELSVSFSHLRPDGTSCYTVLEDGGSAYSVGENISMGQKNAQEAMEAWMSSEGHRANILNKDFTKAGFAAYRLGGTLFWEQLFLG